MSKLKWIDPTRPKRKIKRCQYCGTDVSTPYKGVHDEAELINGIPINCRNNGRMNADIAFPELAKLHEQPIAGVKWFIENNKSHFWWSGFEWTNDPQQAFGCDLKATAERYAKFEGVADYTITEHEFIKP